MVFFPQKKFKLCAFGGIFFVSPAPGGPLHDSGPKFPGIKRGFLGIHLGFQQVLKSGLLAQQGAYLTNFIKGGGNWWTAGPLLHNNKISLDRLWKGSKKGGAIDFFGKPFLGGPQKDATRFWGPMTNMVEAGGKGPPDFFFSQEPSKKDGRFKGTKFFVIWPKNFKTLGGVLGVFFRGEFGTFWGREPSFFTIVGKIWGVFFTLWVSRGPTKNPF